MTTNPEATMSDLPDGYPDPYATPQPPRWVSLLAVVLAGVAAVLLITLMWAGWVALWTWLWPAGPGWFIAPPLWVVFAGYGVLAVAMWSYGNQKS